MPPTTAHCPRVLAAAALGLLTFGHLSVAHGATAPSPAVDTAGGNQLEEVVVTAEKRDSTVLKTAISVTAITGEQLLERGITTVEEVATQTPGISMRSGGPGQTEYEMRGLASSGGSSPTVGFYLDEMVLTPPAGSFNGKVVIDPGLFDLNRVEVLRGPQGTLYGAGSMGGTIKLVTNQPKLDQFDGAVETTLSNTQGGSRNPSGSVMLNIPLIDDRLALRIVGTESYTSGWIDRIVVQPFPLPTNTGCAPTTFYGCGRGDLSSGKAVDDLKNVNWERLQSGRAALLIKATEALSITATAMYQRITMGGFSQFDDPPGIGSTLAHYQPFNQPEPFTDTFRAYNVVANYDAGFANLTSSTAYWSREAQLLQDASEQLQSLYFLGTFYPNIAVPENDFSRQFSEELRLTSNGSGPLRWLVGAYWSKFKSEVIEPFGSPALCYLSTGGCAANPDGWLYNADNPFHVSQYSMFGEGTYAITDTLKATVGLRWFKYSTNATIFENGIETATANATPTTAVVSTSASGFNPKATLAYAPVEDLNIYATAAKGFRPGGINLPVPLVGPTSCLPSLQVNGLTSAPVEYGPDSVWNYELGEKARLKDGRLTVNADVYYIRWTGIQQAIPLPSCGYTYTNNAGVARSYGPELEISAKLTRDLTLTVNGAHTSATIVQTYANTGLPSGTPILNIPRYTESTSLTYEHPISGKLQFMARVDNSYVGPTTDVNYAIVQLPPYNLVNGRIGARSPSWSGYIFLDNATNRIAEYSANNTTITGAFPGLTRISTNQPRTVGLTVRYNFGAGASQ
jgi:outer membrane receptor protein involved in Fe transport